MDGKWGNCGPGCPIPPNDQLSPPLWAYLVPYMPAALPHDQTKTEEPGHQPSQEDEHISDGEQRNNDNKEN